MQRLRLMERVAIKGRDFWGRQSMLVIEPLPNETDWRWLWSVRDGIAITPKIFTVGGFLGRRVVLQHSGRAFHEFEHVAFLHALGLRGVRMWLEGSDWPPFMCQTELWMQARFIQQGPLRPYQPAQESVSSVQGGLKRKVTYTPDHSTDLTLRAVVDYGEGRTGSCTFAFSGDPNKEALARMLSAGTLGRPQVLKPIAKAASKLPWWSEQGAKVLWPPWRGSAGHEFYQELAEHKVLDGALLSFVSPPNSFLAGTVEFYRAGHELDLTLAKSLYPHNNVAAFRKAV